MGNYNCMEYVFFFLLLFLSLEKECAHSHTQSSTHNWKARRGEGGISLNLGQELEYGVLGMRGGRRCGYFYNKMLLFQKHPHQISHLHPTLKTRETSTGDKG
jgi:hypothetical protein